MVLWERGRTDLEVVLGAEVVHHGVGRREVHGLIVVSAPIVTPSSQVQQQGSVTLSQGDRRDWIGSYAV